MIALPETTWTLVVPVKTLSAAKTRLHGHPRPVVMRAFALDAMTAVLASPAVAAAYVVTNEADLATDVRALGCRTLADEGTGDLNRALAVAVAQAGDGPVAALLGDLPCLLPDDLTAALEWAASAGGAYVADAAGTGTSMLAVTDPTTFAPHFGAGSSAAHAAAGYAPVPLDVPTLRLDVDTAEDLRLAIELGVGPHTRAVLG
ncbi:MAG: hypothetical protein JWO46_2468 [Nocardioidaceae bacterium]|nr:hypothetical protein [Nocardioidaceae bacterium]